MGDAADGAAEFRKKCIFPELGRDQHCPELAK